MQLNQKVIDLLADNERLDHSNKILREALKALGSNVELTWRGPVDAENKLPGKNARAMVPLLEELAEKDAEIERLRDVLQKIENWANAYPLEIFPEPDFKLVRKTLRDAGLGLDGVSASNMRHVLNGIKKIVESGLGHNVELTGRN